MSRKRRRSQNINNNDRINKRRRTVINIDSNNDSNTDLKNNSDDEDQFISNQQKLQRSIKKKTRNNHNKKWLNKFDAKNRTDTRTALRNLSNDINKNYEVIKNPMSGQMLQYVEEQEEINKLVTHPEEAARDIDLTKQLSSIVLAQTDELANAQMKVTIDEYMEAIIHTFELKDENNDEDNDDELINIDWKNIGMQCNGYYNDIPTVTSLNGSLHANDEKKDTIEPQKKKRKPVRRRKYGATGNMVRPTEINRTHDKTETKSRVKHVHKLIKQLTNVNNYNEPNRSINLIETLHDSSSFSRTVENYFDFSFIMKEGKSRITIDNGQPFIHHMDSTTMQKYKEQYKRKGKTLQTSQAIVKIDYTTFLNINKAYNLDGKKAKITPKNDDKNNGDCSDTVYNEEINDE